MFTSIKEIKELGVNLNTLTEEDNVLINIFNDNFDPDTTDMYILNYIGLYYKFVIKDNEMAKKYYLKSCEQGYHKAMFNLGSYYQHDEIDYHMMEKYYLMAINLGNVNAMNNLATYYENIKDYVQMEKYYMMAIKKGSYEATINMCQHATTHNRLYMIKLCCETAITNGCDKPEILFTLSDYYRDVLNNHEMTEKYYMMAIAKLN